MDEHMIDQELIKLRNAIKNRLNMAANDIINEEVSKVLGRVKILRSTDLKDMNYTWWIESDIPGKTIKEE